MSSENVSWKKIGCKLSKDTLSTLKKLKFFNPTPIQIHSIPTFLSKKDIVAQAVTGSGKTLSFIIPIMELLTKSKGIKKTDVFSIILSPTTELANQTYEMFNDFLTHHAGVKPLVKLFSNTPDTLDESDHTGIILISTPGKLAKVLDASSQSSMLVKSLKSLEVLIMDEADRLLEMGFSVQLQSIIKILPKQRLTALFSATQTTEVEDLVRTGLRNPVRVSVKVSKGHVSGANDTIPTSLTNYHLTVDCDKKIDLLVRFLRDHADKKVLVFFATCSSVDYFNRILTHILKKHTILCMHRKLKGKRHSIFQQYKGLEKGVMLCTDLMARGIDIPNIDWVVQFDPPKCATNFVHRCGRTARCDQIGQTLLILQPNETVYLNFLTQNQNVQLDEYECGYEMSELESYHDTMQKICANDRLVYEKSVRAFVAYVEYYKKHELKYIFKLRDLNMGQLGNGFGLLRLPQMRELNDVDQSDFKKSELDLKTLEYKDKSVRNIKKKTRVIKMEKREAEDAEKANEQPKSKREWTDEKNAKKSKRAVKKIKKAKMVAENEQENTNDELVNLETLDNMEVDVEDKKRVSAKNNKKAKHAAVEKKDEIKSTATKKRRISAVEGSGLLSFAKKSKL